MDTKLRQTVASTLTMNPIPTQSGIPRSSSSVLSTDVSAE
jgi:hypothetical protein